MQVTKVQTKIGTVMFKQVNEKRFVVRCSKQSPIKLKQTKDGSWEGNAKCFNARGIETVAVGKTAQACYKNAVKSFWL